MIDSSKEKFSISVYYERRADGGVRISSEEIPGFVLSSDDEDAAFQDTPVALEVIIGEILGKKVKVTLPSTTRSKVSNIVDFTTEHSGTISYLANAA